MEELDGFCLTDDLSLTALREKISQLSIGDVTQETYNENPFLHSICINENVTLEIVEYILDSFPGVASRQTNQVTVDDNSTTNVYALHCACYNKHCPSSIIELLLEEFRAAAELLSNVIDGLYDLNIKGLPLHYYFARDSNVDIDTVKLLVEAYPESLMIASDEEDDEICYPIHALLYNKKTNNTNTIIKYMHECSPASHHVLDTSSGTPLHVACQSKNVNLAIVEHLFKTWPESIRMIDNSGYLPIHDLCRNSNIDETDSLEILQFMLDADPNLSRVTTRQRGYLPIHFAVDRMSTAFCKVLIKSYPESIRITSDNSSLPIHTACGFGGRGHRDDTAKTIHHLLDLYPVSINARDNQSFLPIHRAALFRNTESIEVLLKDHRNDGRWRYRLFTIAFGLLVRIIRGSQSSV